MKIENDEQQVQKNVNAALNQSVHQISPDTQARLAERREAALARAENNTSIWQSLFRPAPLAAALTFSLAIVLVLPKVQETPDSHPTIAAQQFDDLLLLSELDDDTLALMEDIEFAYWLAEDWSAEETESQSGDATLETHTSYARPQAVDERAHPVAWVPKFISFSPDQNPVLQARVSSSEQAWLSAQKESACLAEAFVDEYFVDGRRHA